MPRNFRFSRSRHKIEVDITWQCNLTCFDCNRCCGTAPSGEHMTLAQIDKFINESIEKEYDWQLIRIIGGEPTLHPNFWEIIDLFLNYRNRYPEGGKPEIILCTNGYSQKTKDVLDALPEGISIDNSEKERDMVYHIGHFNAAPIDIRDTSDEDFTLACTNATYCGMGLTAFGYYHCPVAGSIDRVFGFDAGKKELPDQDDDMHDMMNQFCKYCGFYDMCDKNVVPVAENLTLLTETPTISKSWQEAYSALKENGGSHHLSLY